MTRTFSIDPVSPRLQRVLAGFGFAGAAAFVVGLLVDPRRAWAGYLMAFLLLTELALGGAVFVAFLALARARWAATVRRIPEAMSQALPWAAGLGLLLLLGLPALYEWTHASAVAGDPLLQHKAPWLDEPLFALRLVLFFALWIGFARGLSRASIDEDEGIARARSRRYVRACVFVPVFAITFALASFDWLMSLEPHWFSTIYALSRFAAMACAALASGILLALWLEARGPLRGRLREDHRHDLGKLLFAFTLFWAYTWYCEYMLIWYSNIPEETVHYAVRKEGGWWLLVRASLVLQWGVPFLALLARRACRSRTVLARVAAVVLAGHLVDLLVQVGPPVFGAELRLGPLEILPPLGALAVFFLLALRALRGRALAPAEDTDLTYSLHYHTP